MAKARLMGDRGTVTGCPQKSADALGAEGGAKSGAVREGAVLALLSEKTISQAALKSGVNERTLRRRLSEDEAFTVYQFSLAVLFDQAGRLRALNELPPEILAEIKSFEVVRTTRRVKGETLITEELIRVKTHDRRTASVTRRGGTTISAKAFISQPLLRRRITTVRERRIGVGRTAAADATKIPGTGRSARYEPTESEIPTLDDRHDDGQR
jgi:hypothetical protein